MINVQILKITVYNVLILKIEKITLHNALVNLDTMTKMDYFQIAKNVLNNVNNGNYN